MIKTTQPTTTEWAKALVKPGTKGGLGATITTYEETRRVAETTTCEPRMWTADFQRRGAKLLGRIAKRLYRFRRGAVVPYHTVPGEIFLTILWPYKQTSGYSREETGIKTGLGAEQVFDRDVAYVPRFFLEELVVHTLRAEAAPVRTGLSQGWQLDKKNSARGCKGLRLIHGLFSFRRGLFRELYLQVPPAKFAPYEHGTLKRARREETMFGARITGWRLADTGLPHATWGDRYDKRLCLRRFRRHG